MYLHLISMSSSRPKDALLSCSVYNNESRFQQEQLSRTNA